MSYKPLHLEAQQRLQEEGCVVDIKLFPNKRVLMTHKYRASIVVLSINKSVEPNEEQKEMTSGFQ